MLNDNSVGVVSVLVLSGVCFFVFFLMVVFHLLVVQLEFARRKSDGSTTLAILNPADPSAGGK